MNLLKLTSIIGTLILATVVNAEETVSAFLGYDTSKARNYDLKNPVSVYQWGAKANNTKSIKDGSNVFTFNFGKNASATFKITDTWSPENLRQLGSGISGPSHSGGNNKGNLVITLVSVKNLSSIKLDWLSIGSVSKGDFTSTLPDGSVNTRINHRSGNLNAIWKVGQSVVLSHTDANKDGFNLEGFQTTALPKR